MVKKILLVLPLFVFNLLVAKIQLPLNREEAEKIVEAVYAEIDQSPYGIDSKEIDEIRKNGGDSTYGEITYDSVNQLIDHAKFIKNDTFYDFGCGRGRACMQIALQTPANIVGIDLSSTRIAIANKAKSILKEKHHIDLGKRLLFKNESFIKTPLAKRGGIVIYACATCFPGQLMKEIGERAFSAKPLARLYTLKKIPDRDPDQELTWSMSWSLSVSCYYYDTRHKKSS